MLVKTFKPQAYRSYSQLLLQDTFPAETFVNAGEKLLQPDYEPRFKAIYREEDLEQGQAIARLGLFSFNRL